MRTQPTSADAPTNALDRTDVLPVLDVEAYEATLVESQKSLSRTDTWTVEALRDIESVTTSPVDLGDAAESFSEEVDLDLPEGVTAQPDTVSVDVTVEQANVEATIGVAPRFVNVAPGLTSSTSTAIVLVTLSGPLNVLQDVGPEEVQAVVDLAGLGPGTYTLTVSVQVPDGVTVVRASPVQITVTLAPAP